MNNLLDDPAYRLGQALRGFHRAKLRCDALGDEAALDDIFLDLTEALWWAYSVDEGIDGLVGDGVYRAAREKDWQGGHLRGIRYARNRAGHQRALTVARSGGLTFSSDGITLPLTISPIQVVWRPLPDLPLGFPDPGGQKAYKEYLAGCRATETLVAAAGWFASAQNRWPEELGIGAVHGERPT